MGSCRTTPVFGAAEPGPAACEVARVGDEVVAQDGSLGWVDRVIRFETRDPAYIVVAVGRGVGKRYPIILCCLVTGIDHVSRCIHLRGRGASLRRLPESPPIVV